MPRFNQQNAVDAIEVQQLIVDWGYELDAHGGADIAGFCTDNCQYIVGGMTHHGHADVAQFYAARNERVRTQQKDGVRTQRHTISNFRVTFSDQDHAIVNFILVNYSAEGKAPALNLVGPTIVADCRMKCRREAGEWRISLFDSTPVFIGNDPFLNASAVKK